MISIGKIFSFSAAHKLPHHLGQCANDHGHNYKLEVEVGFKGKRTGSLLQTSGPAQGMVMDFNDLTAIVSQTILDHDHKYLNDIYLNPTAENMLLGMAAYIKASLPMGIEIKKLRLWETEKCYAEWTED